MGGTALAQEEVEPNEGIQRAQQLTIGPDGTIAVNGAIGSPSGSPIVLDTDFYSFHGQKGDVVTIDIDGGIGGAGNVDTMLTLFGPGPTYQWLYEIDDVRTLDPGSTHFFDARIDNFVLPETGVYTVAVTANPVAFVRFGTGATYRSTTPASNGDYTIVISGVTPAPTVQQVQQVKIDIKPGSGAFAPVNPKEKSTIPVALISSDDFNALDVKIDETTPTFGSTGEERSLRKCGKHGEDVNRDGRLDLVCHFDNQLANFKPEDAEAILKGVTNNGLVFEGRDLLKIVPVKRRE
jgi:hypothetical protein